MAITKYTITGATWTPISSAGQSGTCWLNGLISGGGKVVINHSKTGTGALLTAEGYPVADPSKNEDAVQIVADDLNDIFYARCTDSLASAILFADVRTV
ncbi:MAG: hypothetical protein OEV44_01380 [Spirochaetota bacterium]|nr:hypothetical protein [Spirochaetota bacterium]